ncbi:MAG: Holliday junction branch migration protein RuvA [bacterium]
MINHLRGELLENSPPHLVLDVSGVGYALEAPMSTSFALPPVGSEVTLLTHFQVREDAHTLFAFLTSQERFLFRALLKVNGVGAKVALAILSTLSPSEFHGSVLSGDVASLTRVPGIGKKTAERLIVEMKDRLGDMDGLMDATAVPAGTPMPPVTVDAVAEAEQALVALGYKPQEASRMVASVETDGLGIEAIIKEALQAMLK